MPETSATPFRWSGLSIRYKLGIILMASAVLPVLLGMMSIHYLGNRYHERDEGLVFQATARYLSVSLTKSIENEVGQFVEWAGYSGLAPAMVQQAVVDPAPDSAELMAEVDRIERAWPGLAPGDPLLQGILNNPVVDALHAYQQRHPRFVEILVTDASGRLVAATNKSSDYYQADEDWWQNAMAAPAGTWVVEGIAYDESAGVYSIDVSMAIASPDAASRERIGVMKGVLDTTALFRNVRRIGDTEGPASVIALPQGRILVSLFQSLEQPLVKSISRETIVRFEPTRPIWVRGSILDIRDALLGVAPLWLQPSDRRRAGEESLRPMWVVVFQDRDTVMAPFNRQMRLLLFGGGLLGAGCALLGMVMAHIKFVKPLAFLRKSAGQLAGILSGGEVNEKESMQLSLLPVMRELDRIKTGDEIEDVADDFRIMADKLAEYHNSLAAYQGHLEGLVEERTKELKTANEDLEAFAYIVSHDLKAPLRAISSVSTWLANDYGDKLDDEGRELIEMMQGRVKRLGDLVNGILEYSRASRSEGRKDTVDLQNVVMQVVDALDCPEHITFSCPDALPTVTGDETQLGQIFQNLLSNAFKYMDKPKGRVELRCARKQDTWEFSLADNGPGIEEKYHDRIFKVFQTLNARDDVESTGVGLSVVKRFIERAGGSIRVESEAGAGTTFIFTWPVDEGA